MVHVSIAPEILFTVLGIPVTNTLLTSWVVMVILIVVSIIISRNIKEIPGKLQNMTEIILTKLADFLETIAGSKETVRKFFPVAATIFIFILCANWIGILPGVGSIGFTHKEEPSTLIEEETKRETGEVIEAEKIEEPKESFVPLLRSVNSDLNMTLALALIIVTMSHIVGLVTIGARDHISKFFSFKSPIKFFVGLLEFISELAKIISFSFRLFGNVFAGEVLLVIIAFLVPYIAPIPFLGLEIFVGFIQALIFTVLTMMFLGAATASHTEAH